MADKKINFTLTAQDKTAAGFSSAKRNIEQLGRQADQMGAQFKSALGSLGLAVGGGYAVKSLAAMADEFANLQARLKLASRDQNEFNAANADLVRISESALAPLSETATLYTRIAASVKDLDVSQRDVASTTEAVALALRISGASAAESSSAMLQFSQAIASGVLRGEEFNAVNESAPRLLQALATSLKVPVGELREMAKQGQLTRDVLISGLLNELPTLRAEASTLPKTIGAAFTNLQNKLLLTIGEFDKLTGTTNSFSTALNNIGTTGIEALAVVGANVAFVFRGIGTEIGGIAAQLSRLVVGDLKGASEIGRLMREDAAKARADLDAFEKRILGGSTESAALAATSTARRVLPALGGAGKTAGKGGTKADPLAGILSQTDTARAAEYEKLLGLLEKRFDAGRKNAQQYGEAVAILNKQFGKESIDPLGSGSFSTTSKDVADMIREQQEVINDLNGEMAQDGVAAAQAYESALASLLAGTTVAKTAELYENIDTLNRAFFDGVIGVEQYEQALALLTTGAADKLKETNDFAKELGLTLSSAFEEAVVGGEKLSDVLEGLAQDIAQMLVRKNVTTPLANLIGGIDFGSLFGFANGGIMTGSGPLPLHAYAGGGIASSPQVALFGEGDRPEAFVPLPDGRRIPVAMKGGGGTVINLNISTPDANSFRASSGQIAAQMTRALVRGRRFT